MIIRMFSKKHFAAIVTLVSILGYTCTFALDVKDAPVPVMHWDTMALQKVSKVQATLSSSGTGSQAKVRVEFTQATQPSLRIPLAAYDLSSSVGLALAVTNHGSEDLVLRMRLDDKATVGGVAIISAGATDTLGVLFRRSSALRPAYILDWFANVNGIPGGFTPSWDKVDPANLNSLQIYCTNPSGTSSFSLGRLYAWGAFSFPTEQCLAGNAEQCATGTFSPWVDPYGQYKNESWPNKVTSAGQLAQHRTAETQELALHPAPAARDSFRGWTDGPQLQATGHFRTAKHNGRWWLVTPTGRLFWSWGTDVNIGSATRVAGRNHWFDSLPEANEFYGTRDGNKTVDFGKWNIARKYGADYVNAFYTRTHERLLSWGMNSYAGWSSGAFQTATHKTPYFKVSFLWPSNIDVRDTAAFRTKMRNQLGALSGLDSDKWLVGVFVGNELEWGHIGADSLARVAGVFYRIIRSEFKRALPNKLYMCDRQNTNIAVVKDTAAAYCDVVSFNRYQLSAKGSMLKANANTPTIISEFHFGTLQNGGLGAGLVGAASQRNRAHAMEAYMREMLVDSNVVGAHWFQYMDQPITARANDQENFKVGMLAITDQPDQELVLASRRLGHAMYGLRSNNIWEPWPELPAVKFVNPNADSISLLAGVSWNVEVAVQTGGSPLSYVMLYVNGDSLRREKTAPFEWGHQGSPNPGELMMHTEGKHVLVAEAVDLLGNKSRDTLRVNVAEAPVMIWRERNAKKPKAVYQFDMLGRSPSSIK